LILLAKMPKHLFLIDFDSRDDYVFDQSILADRLTKNA